MSDENGSGAPATGEQGSSGQQPPAGGSGEGSASSPGWADAPAWKTLADELGLSPDKVREKVTHARTWEQRAKENKGAADEKTQLQQQLDEIKKQLAERDVADVERNGKLALAQVQTQLAAAGVSKDDASALLAHFDPVRLLKDGHPSDEAITALAGSLTKLAGRPTPDPDQGKGAGSKGPVDMNSMIRRAAGVPN